MVPWPSRFYPSIVFSVAGQFGGREIKTCPIFLCICLINLDPSIWASRSKCVMSEENSLLHVVHPSLTLVISSQSTLKNEGSDAKKNLIFWKNVAHDLHSINLVYSTVNREPASADYLLVVSLIPSHYISPRIFKSPFRFFLLLQWRVRRWEDGEHQEGHPVSGCSGLLTQRQEGQQCCKYPCSVPMLY